MKMAINKKGMTTETVIKLLLGMIIIGIAIYLLFFKGVKPAESTLNPILQQQTMSLCKAKGDLAKVRGTVGIKDCDNDGYPDICDVCLGGVDNQDSNINNVPDSCENVQMVYDKKATLLSICQSAIGGYKSWNEEKKQCTLTSYNPNC